VPSQRCRSIANVRAEDPESTRPELRIPTAAAQTRIISGSEFSPKPTGIITTSQVHGVRTDS
jgi:hypothetical protein